MVNEGRNFAVALSHADHSETGFLDELIPEMVRMGRVVTSLGRPSVDLAKQSTKRLLVQVGAIVCWKRAVAEPRNTSSQFGDSVTHRTYVDNWNNSAEKASAHLAVYIEGRLNHSDVYKNIGDDWETHHRCGYDGASL